VVQTISREDLSKENGMSEALQEIIQAKYEAGSITPEDIALAGLFVTTILSDTDYPGDYDSAVRGEYEPLNNLWRVLFKDFSNIAGIDIIDFIKSINNIETVEKPT
jgi:hypothetical protein